jgi:metallo-beta-lactamase family protein
MTRLSFLGAAGCVTGSKFLVETDHARVLVDCGLFQGEKPLRLRNWQPPPFAPNALDAVVLTHAHIDHTGYLPRLRQQGFRGRAHCTDGTRDLLEVLLPDSGYLQEEAARFANRHGISRHHPALPLYTEAEALDSLGALAAHGSQAFEAAPGISVRFSRAGHILGSACVQLETSRETIVFSGDVGRPADPIMRPPDPAPPGDFLVVESIYGDRSHPPEPVSDALAEYVVETAAQGGVMLVPAFAVGRAQHLLHVLAELRRQQRIPGLPIFLDSPMAIDATELFFRHAEDHRLSRADCHALCKLATYTRTADESKAIDRRAGPMIVISASGMLNGGRILHHLRRFLPDPRTLVLLVGYQAAGTRGRALLEGAAELKLLGQYVPVRGRVVPLPGLSAHADAPELVAWLRGRGLAPRRTFVVHGEPVPAEAMRRRLEEELRWNAVVPPDGSTWTLD